MLIVYGLKSCDTCRKARKWLDSKGLAHRFHDVRADGLEAEDVRRWIAAAGWESLLNRRGTTWRGLPELDREGLDEARAAALMHAHPVLIKRPVFETGGKVIVGFTEEVKAALAGGSL